ncbi:MAG: hypothetical protein AAF065_12480 [Verrucomicrobiota bacterium]
MKTQISIIGFVISLVFLSSEVYSSDNGKNFTVSDSPETTVFNLRVPSVNRHIRDRGPSDRIAEESTGDCGDGRSSDYIDQYHGRLEKIAPSSIHVDSSYSVQLQFRAKDRLKNAVIREQIPAGAEYVSSEPPAQVSGNEALWILRSLSAGEIRSLSLELKPTALGELKSTATMDLLPYAGGALYGLVEPSSNSGPGAIDHYLVRLEDRLPKRFYKGRSYDWEFLLTAKDDVDLVVVKTLIPDASEYLSSKPEIELSGNEAYWSLRNLEKGKEYRLRMRLKAVEQKSPKHERDISVFPAANTTAVAGSPNLVLEVSAPHEQVFLGSGLPWEVSLLNAGKICAYDVVVDVHLADGISHPSGVNMLSTQIGTLAPGESRTLTLNTESSDAGTFCTKVLAFASNADSAESQGCVAVVKPQLEVRLDGTPMQFLGKKATYSVQVGNVGGVPLTDIEITQTIPEANYFISTPKADMDVSDGILKWKASLEAGELKTYDFEVVGTQPGVFCHQVSAASGAYGLVSSDDVCTEWKGYPALLLEMIDTEDPILVGEETTYVIQITNQGTGPDFNVRLNIQVPPEFYIQSAAGNTKGVISGNSISFAPYPILQPKEIIEFRLTAKAVSTGDGRVQAEIDSDLLRLPLPEEEATQVY